MPVPGNEEESAIMDRELLRRALVGLAEAQEAIELLKGQNHQLVNRVSYLEGRVDSFVKGLKDLTYRHEQLAMHFGNRADALSDRLEMTSLELHHARDIINKLVNLQENGTKIDQGLHDAQSRSFWIVLSALNAVVELSNQVRALTGGTQDETRGA